MERVALLGCILIVAHSCFLLFLFYPDGFARCYSIIFMKIVEFSQIFFFHIEFFGERCKSVALMSHYIIYTPTPANDVSIANLCSQLLVVDGDIFIGVFSINFIFAF